MGTERSRQRKRSPKQCATELATEQRREKACDLRLGGWSVRAIAAELKVSVGTVHNDITAVLERAKDNAVDAVEKEKRLSLGRIDRAIRALWAKIEAGDPEAARVLVQLEQRRAKVEGFDAADKHEVSGPGGAAIAIEPRLAIGSKLDDLAKRLGGTGQPGGDASSGPPATG